MATISVAMCTCEGAAYVTEQLESIVAQTRKPDELVIYDDRSTDRTVEIVNAFAKKAPFEVNVSVNEQRLGTTANFERAIGACTGEIIALSDQDDVWYLDKLARMEQTFVEAGDSLGGVFSDADLIDGDGHILGARMWEYFGFNGRLQMRVHNGAAFDVLLRKHIVPGCTIAFRREYRSLLLPLPRIGIHDRWIALLVAGVAKFDAIPQPLMKYRKHQNQQQGVALTSVGAALRTGALAEQVVRAERPAAKIYEELASLYESAVQRLLDAGYNSIGDDVLRKLKDKIAHLKVRATLPRSLSQRLPVILRELRKSRYHRYSNGVYSLARDTLFGS